MHSVHLPRFSIGKQHPLSFICGPCAIESLDHSLFVAEQLTQIFNDLKLNFVFKSSFDKANRSSVSSNRGVGMEEGLKILQKVKDEFSIPVTTDIHLPEQAKPVADVCDILQIPAFLCRQTDLLLAAAHTKKIVHAKKAQFMAPWDMKEVVKKIESTGSQQILLCERGTSFGYNTLVNDFRSLPIMEALGYPVIFDATHSVQQPGALGTSSGGQREYVPLLAKAAVAAGCQGIFLEVHPNPEKAISDAKTQLPLNELKPLLSLLKQIHELIKESNSPPSLCIS